MTETEKDRMISLLIEAVDEAGESEGIWFLEDKDALELLELLKKYDPSDKNIKKRNQEIQWLKNKFKSE